MHIPSLFRSNRAQRIWILAKNDFLQRYYGSVLGVVWAFLNPVFRLIIYYLVFAFLVFKNHDPEFILYLFLGIMPWSFFAEGTKRGMKVLQSKRYLLENIRINKYDLFQAHILSVLLGFLFNMLTYFIFRLFFDVELSFVAAWLVFFILNLMLIVFGISMILSTVYTYLRDLDHLWDVLLMAGFWSVPVIWDQQFIFNTYKFMLYINPITGIVVNIREVLLYNHAPHWNLVFVGIAYGFLFLALGVFALKNWSSVAIERK